VAAASYQGQALQRGRYIGKALNVSLDDATGRQRRHGAALKPQSTAAGRRQLDPAQTGRADVQADEWRLLGLKEFFQKKYKSIFKELSMTTFLEFINTK
jgi:hypothetical protein